MGYRPKGLLWTWFSQMSKMHMMRLCGSSSAGIDGPAGATAEVQYDLPMRISFDECSFKVNTLAVASS